MKKIRIVAECVMQYDQTIEVSDETFENLKDDDSKVFEVLDLDNPCSTEQEDVYSIEEIDTKGNYHLIS